jgi:immune inhibitor A
MRIRLQRARAVRPVVLALALMGSSMQAGAVPFRPDVLSNLRASGALPGIVASTEAARARGLDAPPATARGWTRAAQEGRAIPDRSAIVILVDFSDKPANEGTYPPAHYDEMLFSVGTYPTGSMRDWYIENSYGAFQVTGVTTIWLRMPQTYAFYVDGQAGFGTYPHNAQKLAEDAVIAADPYVDFSQYDNDGPDGLPHSGDDDGIVDALFVVHAGLGREETGSNNDIHSHAWGMVSPPAVDGVTADSYSMEPENGKRGVFGHEFGHVLGLPDLYDTDYSSSGVGDWCMMSFGSWGGGGITPVHFMAWCKARLGFIDPTIPLTNAPGASLPKVETSPTAYFLWTGGYPASQYFVVENRQRVASDTYLPGDGLLICHIDESAGGNENESHPLVAVEQADGLNELAQGGASDSGDPWPGSTNNRNFNGSSNPNSRDYAGVSTQVAVRNISNSADTMTADLDVESSPILVFQGYFPSQVSGNFDGDIDPGEDWNMAVVVRNLGAPSSPVNGTLTCPDTDVTITNAATSFGAIGAEQSATGTPPFRFTLSPASTDDGLPFTVRIRDLLGNSTDVSFVVGVNDPLDTYRWGHDNVTSGYLDQWHVSTQRNHTPGGSYAWKCGATGTGSYADRDDAALYSVDLPLSTVDAISFWHWIDAEDDVDNTAWDGGIIEASIDGGAWIQLTPDGGYPYTIIANPDSPFLPDTPCFSGTFDWSPVRIDLTGLSGEQVQLRLRFGSDGYVTQEGWYVDDFTIEGTLTSDANEPDALGSIFLAPPRPNPAPGAATLRFVQPAGSGAAVSVIDPAGRRIAGWTFPAATGAVTREVRWDGRTGDGRAAASGVYFIRLQTSGEERTQRLLLLR